MAFLLPTFHKETWKQDLQNYPLSEFTREQLGKALKTFFGSRVPYPKITDEEYGRINEEVVAIRIDRKTYLVHRNSMSSTLRLVREK